MKGPGIFLSYSHQDAALAQRASALLAAHGYEVWWDHRLQAGDDFRATIANQIREASGVVALFSDHSVHSGWVLDEAGRALQLNTLVPVLVGSCELPLGFGTLHHCPLSVETATPVSPETAALIEAVEKVTQQPSAPFSEERFQAALAAEPPAPDKRQSRFHIGWFPSRAIIVQVLALAVVYIFALGVAFFVHHGRPIPALKEWVKLLHIYSGMIVLGAGIFLFSMLRISDRQPTSQERAAAGDLIRPMMGGWRFAALAQLVTGFTLVWLLGYSVETEWVLEAGLTYLCALYLWWLGFWNGMKAIESEALFRDRIVIREFRGARDLHLTVALVLTAWALTLMVYKDDASLPALIARLH